VILSPSPSPLYFLSLGPKFSPRHSNSSFVIPFLLQTKFRILKNDNIVIYYIKLYFSVVLYRVELVVFVNILTQVSLTTQDNT
jgi:hypothetical protein